MIDTSQINLLQLCGKDTNLRHAANTRGGEYSGACPRCGGEDRFRVQPATGMWCCRQCHEKWSDAIGYVMWFDGVNFKAAADILKLPLDSRPFNPRVRIATNPNDAKPLGNDYASLNDPDWQACAKEFTSLCAEHMYYSDADKVREYLENRGISFNVVESAGLGYNPSDYKGKWGLTDVFLPRGIIIPWLIGGQVWRVNCRPPTPVNGKKYIQATGSANGLYNADAVRRYRTVIITEGEFDSLVIRSHAPEFTAVATGTASWARVTRWVSRLSLAEDVLLAFDTDEAGESAVTWWQGQLGTRAQHVTPLAHDVTDMWKAGQSIGDWLAPYNMAFSMPITVDMERRRQEVREQEFLRWGYELNQLKAS